MQDYLYSVIGFIAIAVQLIINYKVMFTPGNYMTAWKRLSSQEDIFGKTANLKIVCIE